MDAPERMEDMRFPGELPRTPSVTTPGTDAPERIRADRYGWVDTSAKHVEPIAEYVRADLCARLAAENERLRAALARQVKNVERWMETGEPAGPVESRSIYEQMRAALEKRDE